jgi:Flp pilus assembly protein TadD
MFPIFFPKPSPKRLPGLIAGFVLAALTPFAGAQTLADIQNLMKDGKMPQALEQADRYIASRPRDAQGPFMKGVILSEMGRPQDAIKVFTELTEAFPELPEPYNNLAVLYARQKQYDKAQTALEMAIRTHPDYAIAHENLGDVYAKLASRAYDKALQLDSSNKAAQTKLKRANELVNLSTQPAR